MVLVAIYLILLTAGAGLLVVKGKQVRHLSGASWGDTGLRLSGEPWSHSCPRLLIESS